MRKCGSMLMGVTVVGVVSPLLGGCEPNALPVPPPAPDPGDTTADGVAFDVSILTADNTSVATDIKGSDGFGILIVRRTETDYIALSMLCTHQACSVDRRVSTGGPINCGCHGSQFNLDGTVKKGPAPQPLKSYVTTYDATTRIVRIKVT